MKQISSAGRSGQGMTDWENILQILEPSYTFVQLNIKLLHKGAGNNPIVLDTFLAAQGSGGTSDHIFMSL